MSISCDGSDWQCLYELGRMWERLNISYIIWIFGSYIQYTSIRCMLCFFVYSDLGSDWQCVFELGRLWESSLWRLVHRIPIHQLKLSKTLPNTLPNILAKYERTQTLQRNADLTFVTFLAGPKAPIPSHQLIYTPILSFSNFLLLSLGGSISYTHHIEMYVGEEAGGLMLLNFLNVKDL